MNLKTSGRKVIVLSFITLDGVMQGPGGADEDTSGGFKHGGWIVPYPLGDVMREQMSRPFDLLLGRKTYEIFAGYWPQHGNGWPSVNKARKYVASHRDMKLEWENSVLLKGDVPEEVRKLKGQEGPELQVYGSGNRVKTLLKHDLVDELWLKIFPITLGTGKKLFADGPIPAAFTLQDSQVTPNGVIVASYKRAGNVKTRTF